MVKCTQWLTGRFTVANVCSKGSRTPSRADVANETTQVQILHRQQKETRRKSLPPMSFTAVKQLLVSKVVKCTCNINRRSGVQR